MARQQVQHVIEEADARVALAGAVAVERQRQVDVGLAVVRSIGWRLAWLIAPSIVANASLHRPRVQLEALGPGERRGRAAPARAASGRSAPR